MTVIETRSRRSIRLRSPNLEDGIAIHQLIASCPPLDLNSVYAYLIQAMHHAPTCVVAEGENGLAGYLSAYLHPRQPRTLFIWQLAVSSAWRGDGLALAMLRHLVGRGQNLRWLETTITPSNTASLAVFRALARQLEIGIEPVSELSGSLFPESGHPPETLYRLGPLTPAA
ncbi:diaminobutyrate acetyltransferase [Chitinolyticbacter meiyuanensis]|uniref:diaminobutyrate acetyltransferase n=1 Tax=Chitinolyticbacter meiyuanensis TaxID=682798 RepID=UPI001651F4EE|nr:diaminobutyrate acetyltransferase [Chitinolyticbacter meiyuanensis]